MNILLKSSLTAAALITLGASTIHSASAQVTTFFNVGKTSADTVTNIAGDGDVIRIGKLVLADAFVNGVIKTPTTTVNGTAFTNNVVIARTEASGLNVMTGSKNGVDVLTTGFVAGGPFFTSSAAPFAKLSANYRAVLQGGMFGTPGNFGNVAFRGLIPGHSYLLQIWVEDPRGATNRLLGVDEAVDLRHNIANGQQAGDSTHGIGATGQFAVSNFVADASGIANGNYDTQGIANNVVLVNALQLRDLSAK